MYDVFRDSAIGQWIRLCGGKSFARYPEEFPDFNIPLEYSQEKPTKPIPRSMNQTIENAGTPDELEDKPFPGKEVTDEGISMAFNDSMEEFKVVTWYSDNDPENPHNWSIGKKMSIAVLIMVYTISVYIGSSLYTASTADVMSIFGASSTVASLGLALYVLGYGIGPLPFAPLSEIPIIGRIPSYIYTYIDFVVLSLAAALVNKLAGLLVLRFLLGIFGFPSLANVGGSYGDFFGATAMPYASSIWAD